MSKYICDIMKEAGLTLEFSEKEYFEYLYTNIVIKYTDRQARFKFGTKKLFIIDCQNDLILEKYTLYNAKGFREYLKLQGMKI